MLIACATSWLSRLLTTSSLAQCARQMEQSSGNGHFFLDERFARAHVELRTPECELTNELKCVRCDALVAVPFSLSGDHQLGGLRSGHLSGPRGGQLPGHLVGDRHDPREISIKIVLTLMTSSSQPRSACLRAALLRAGCPPGRPPQLLFTMHRNRVQSTSCSPSHAAWCCRAHRVLLPCHATVITPPEVALAKRRQVLDPRQG